MTDLKPLRLLPAFLMLFVLYSCDKDPEQTGCSDPLAVNYNPQALKDDGSCQYNQEEQTIWQNGQYGGWNGDYYEGGYRLVACEGQVREDAKAADDSTETISLYLAAGDDSKHRSLFTLLNEHDARDFAEGSLRFDARLPDSSAVAPETLRLFISGKIDSQSGCEPFRRSTFTEISTRALNDSVFTEVSVPLRHFAQLHMSRVQVVAGFAFEAIPGSGLEIDRVRWVANDKDE